MPEAQKKLLLIGDWSVDPLTNSIVRDGTTVRLDERAMRLLVVLATSAGEVVSIESLLKQVWPEVIVTSDSVYQAIASLRRQLGDDPKKPTYIATAPRLGYRMIANVERPNVAQTTEHSARSNREPGAPDSRKSWSRAWPVLAFGIALAIGFFVYYGFAVRSSTAAASSKQPNTAFAVNSVGVLPLVDLTEGMNEEIFADGITEELIDKLSRAPGMRVPAPTASFFFKGKRVALSTIAESLGVSYIIDGSVRKSDDMLRIAVRLVRASDGRIVWSETFDRPLVDKLRVQDEIAGEVAKALAGTGD